MKVYSTEEEQIQALVNWFKLNGVKLLVVLSITTISFFGWNYWQDRNQYYTEQASTLYEELKVSNNDQQKIVIANQLVKDYKSSIYGKIAALFLTNKKVNEKKWAEAESEYKWIYEQTAVWPELQIVVFENWIRTQLELKQSDKAFDNITTAESKTDFVKLYPINFYNLKGDVLYSQNKNNEAVEAYNVAIASVDSNPELQQQTVQFMNWIVLKRNDLLAAKPLK